jgi:hypothetical protein
LLLGQTEHGPAFADSLADMPLDILGLKIVAFHGRPLSQRRPIDGHQGASSGGNNERSMKSSAWIAIFSRSGYFAG